MAATDAFAALYGRLSAVVLRPADRPGEGARALPATPGRPSLLLPRLAALRPKAPGRDPAPLSD